MFLSIFDLLWSCGDFGSMIRLVIDEPTERRAPKERRKGGREAGPDADLLPDRERMPRRGERAKVKVASSSVRHHGATFKGGIKKVWNGTYTGAKGVRGHT